MLDLQGSQTTPYDLQFQLGRVPVRVHPFFWLAGTLMGSELFRRDTMLLFLLWMGVLFFSILVHELGHAWAAIRSGARSNILLYAFGGLAFYSPSPRHRLERILISFAGPLAGFLLAFIACLLLAVSGHPARFEWDGSWFPNIQIDPRLPLALQFFLDRLLFINIGWGIFNLFPIWPLDGGHIARELFLAQRPWDGERLALQLGLALSVLLGVIAWKQGMGQYTVLLCATLAANQYVQLQQSHRR